MENLHNPGWNDIKWSSRTEVFICFPKLKYSDIDLIMLNNAKACSKSQAELRHHERRSIYMKMHRERNTNSKLVA